MPIRVLGAAPHLTGPVTESGAPITAVSVPAWSIPTGVGMYMGTAVQDGISDIITDVVSTASQLLSGSMTLRNAAGQPTGTQMVLHVTTPGTPDYAHVIVPTDLGATSVVGSDGFSGGADISDLIEIDLGDGITRVAAVCFSDYHGWNIGTYGRFPAYLVFERDPVTLAWSYDAARSKTIDQLYTSAPAGFRDALFESRTNGFAESYRFDPGMNEIALCPISGHLLVTCYFPSSTTNSGSIIAIDPATSTVVAYLRLPDFFTPTVAHVVQWAPREIQTDPSGTATTRAVVLADCYDITANASLPHTMCEILYDPAGPTLTQVSAPCLPPLDDTDYATAGWSPDGVLYAATHFVSTTLAGLASKSLNVFRVGTPLPASGSDYGTQASPSYTVASMAAAGATPFVLEQDPTTGTVITVGAFGGRIRSWRPASPDVDNPTLALNPTFAVNVTDWSGRLLTCSVAWDAGDGGRLKATGNGSASTMSCRQTNEAVPVGSTGRSMVCYATVRAGVAGSRARVGIDFCDAGGAILFARSGSWRSTSTGATTDLWGDCIVPDGVALYRIFVEWDTNVAGDVHYVLTNDFRFAPGTDYTEVDISTSMFVTGQSNVRRGGFIGSALAVVVQPYLTTHPYPSAPYDLDSYVVTIPISYLIGEMRVGLALVGGIVGVGAGGRVHRPSVPLLGCGTRVELAFGADLRADPASWAWTDVGNSFDVPDAPEDPPGRLFDQTIRIHRGRADETSTTQAGGTSFDVDNDDGAMTPGNPLSTYYPNVRRDTPCRISVEVPTYLQIPGDVSRSGVSTPDSAALSIVGDFFYGVDWTPFDGVATEQIIGAKYSTVANQRSWELIISGGKLLFRWSADGITDNEVELPFDSSHHQSIGVGLDVDDGAGGHVVTLYSVNDWGDPWVPVISVTGAGTTSVFDSNAPLAIGNVISIGAHTDISVYHAELRTGGPTGVIVANPDLTGHDVTTTSFDDDEANTWTLVGHAVFVDRVFRFHGQVSEIAPSWPGGDLSFGSYLGESRTSITANGVLRRLGQGTKPLESTIKRLLLNPSSVIDTDARTYAYWPMDDEAGATQMASALPDGVPGTVTDFAFAADSGLRFSKPLMHTTSDGRFIGVIPNHAATTVWSVGVLAKLTDLPASPDYVELLRVETTGVARRIRITANTTTVTITYTDRDGVETTNTVLLAGLREEWVLLFVTAVKSGTNVDYTVGWHSIESNLNGTDTQTLAGVIGKVNRVSRGGDGPSNGITYGHLAVTNFALQSVITIGTPGPYNGYDEEAAADRFMRLCAENDIAAVLYDNDVPTLTELMGVQRPTKLLELLQECAIADLGVVLERVDTLGLAFRARCTLQNQRSFITLDARGNQIANPFQPVLDDQRLRNEIIVQRVDGSSYLVMDPAIDLGEIEVYDESVSVNVADDDQLPDIAGWRLHLGMWDQLRYPKLSVDLAIASEVVSSLMDVLLEDMVRIDNLPPQLPGDDVELLLEDITESISPANWKLEFSCSPYGPWIVGIWEDDVLGRADTSGSELVSDVDDTTTALSVATTDGPVWIDTAGFPDEFPFDAIIDGEVVTVTAIVGTTSPQAFTVTRSTNTIVKSHPAGASVVLAHPAIAAI